jgi:hypothetical protein
MVDHFAAHTVFLVCENERGGGGSLHVRNGCHTRFYKTIADEKLQVMQSESRVVGGGAHIFSGAQQIVESADGHVSDGFDGVYGRGCGMECDGEDCVDDLDGDPFYAGWGVIFSTPGAELSLDAEVNVSGDRSTRVLGPHTGEPLAHRT